MTDKVDEPSVKTPENQEPASIIVRQDAVSKEKNSTSAKNEISNKKTIKKEKNADEIAFEANLILYDAIKNDPTAIAREAIKIYLNNSHRLPFLQVEDLRRHGFEDLNVAIYKDEGCLLIYEITEHISKYDPSITYRRADIMNHNRFMSWCAEKLKPFNLASDENTALDTTVFNGKKQVKEAFGRLLIDDYSDRFLLKEKPIRIRYLNTHVDRIALAVIDCPKIQWNPEWSLEEKAPTYAVTHKYIENKEIFARFCAKVLDHRSEHQQVLIPYGEGGDGKSCVIDGLLVTAMNKKTVSVVDSTFSYGIRGLENISGAPFGFADDIKSRTFNGEAFKAVFGGSRVGFAVFGRGTNEEVFNFPAVLCTNDPLTDLKDQATRNRCIPIKFKKISDKDKIESRTEVKNKLWAERMYIFSFWESHAQPGDLYKIKGVPQEAFYSDDEHSHIIFIFDQLFCETQKREKFVTFRQMVNEVYFRDKSIPRTKISEHLKSYLCEEIEESKRVPITPSGNVGRLVQINGKRLWLVKGFGFRHTMYLNI